MPLIFNNKIDLFNTHVAVWENNESNDFFMNKLNLDAHELRLSLPEAEESTITYIFESMDGDRDGVITFEEYYTQHQNQIKQKQAEVN